MIQTFFLDTKISLHVFLSWNQPVGRLKQSNKVSGIFSVTTYLASFFFFFKPDIISASSRYLVFDSANFRRDHTKQVNDLKVSQSTNVSASQLSITTDSTRSNSKAVGNPDLFANNHVIFFEAIDHHHHHHHHHIVLAARISLTLFRHSSLSFIALGRSSGQQPVSSHSCWMYVRAGRPAFARPCVGIHKSTSLMSSSLLLKIFTILEMSRI